MLDAELEFVPKMLASFSHSFDSMSVEEKRSALRLFIDKVVWNGKTVDLYLMGTSDTSLSKVSEPLQRGSQYNANSSVDQRDMLILHRPGVFLSKTYKIQYHR